MTYFITLFPYLVLTTFLVFGIFQDGFASGITEYYLKVGNWPHMPSDYILVSALIFLLSTHAKSSLRSDENLQPDWDRLFSDYKIWVAACTQVGDIFWVVNANRAAQI